MAGDRGYKWVVLTNTTLGMLMAFINSSIVMISLPAIFRGIGVNPLAPNQSIYLLWILMGYLMVTAVLLVTCGRLSDMYGRTRLYNLGFAVFTIASIALVFTPGTGDGAATYIVVWRLVQGLGGAFISANSAALLTDAFPANRRGFALGVNQIAAIGGSLIGLIVGGVLATVHWRLVFLVSVPFGLIGTVWAYVMLKEARRHTTDDRLDLIGNAAFALGLTLFLYALTFAIQPYNGRPTGWTSPLVVGGIIVGLALLGAFVSVERRVPSPLFRIELFSNRTFTAGNISGFLSSLARGGLQFMIIIWLQGIWLPLHGVAYEEAPLWAGIYTAPLIAGFIVLGPISGALSDRYGARSFATVGMLITALGFILLTLLPADFDRWTFFVVLGILGTGMGLFAAPNTTSIMNAVPARDRGVASGMRATFQNAATMMSIAVFFSILTTALARTLPDVVMRGLTGTGLSAQAAETVAHLPPISVLFAALLGYNPLQTLIPPEASAQLTAHQRSVLFGTHFFPQLIQPAFMSAIHAAFYVSAAISVIAAIASSLRGRRYVAAE